MWKLFSLWIGSGSSQFEKILMNVRTIGWRERKLSDVELEIIDLLGKRLKSITSKL